MPPRTTPGWELTSTQTVNGATHEVSFAYNLNGSQTNIVYPGNKSVAYTFDENNRLESIDLSSFGESSFDFNYDGANRLTNIVYPNGISTSFGYDDNGLQTSIKHGTFVDRQIVRNVLGFKTIESINAGIKPQAPPAHTRIKTHNEADQLVTETIAAGTNYYSINYSYSETGCLTNQVGPATTNYTYDYNNRLTSVTPHSSPATHYLYDATGSRVGRIHNSVTNYFVIDYSDRLKRPLAESDASGNITRYYIWGGAQLLAHIDQPSGDVVYYHADELGSTLALTDEAGTVTDNYAYLPHGYATHTGSTQTPYQWLGGYGIYFDVDTELHLTLHRAYSTNLKRFIQSDPLGIGGGANVYLWANLNPLFFIDPRGLNPVRIPMEDLVDAYRKELQKNPYNINHLNNVPGTSFDHDNGLKGLDPKAQNPNDVFILDGKSYPPDWAGNYAPGYILTEQFGPAAAATILLTAEVLYPGLPGEVLDSAVGSADANLQGMSDAIKDNPAVLLKSSGLGTIIQGGAVLLNN